MRVYLSHPYTGDEEANAADAKRITDELRLLLPDDEIVNPLALLRPLAGVPYSAVMDIALALLDGCDAIVMSPGWQDSYGCKRECERAMKRDMRVYDIPRLGSKEVLRRLREREERPMGGKAERHQALCDKIHATYVAKNHDYGDSFGQSFKKFGIVAAVVRMGDKLNRVENVAKGGAKVSDETVVDTLMDLANYALMTAMEVEEGSGNGHQGASRAAAGRNPQHGACRRRGRLG